MLSREAGLDGRDSWISGVPEACQLSRLINSKFSERPCLKNDVGNDGGHWFPTVRLHSTCKDIHVHSTYVCMHLHEHTHTHTHHTHDHEYSIYLSLVESEMHEGLYSPVLRHTVMSGFLGTKRVIELLAYPPPCHLGNRGLSSLHTHVILLAVSHAPLCQPNCPAW